MSGVSSDVLFGVSHDNYDSEDSSYTSDSLYSEKDSD